MAQEYPLARAALASPAHFFVYELAYLAYYVAWEAHFRGFLLFGFERSLGFWPAIGATTLASVLVHLPKPAGEFYASIPAGIVWGYLALRSRSIFGPLAVHWLVGVASDLAVAARLGIDGALELSAGETAPQHLSP
jgi:membrane protease YdiL (CAAX protease family)